MTGETRRTLSPHWKCAGLNPMITLPLMGVWEDMQVSRNKLILVSLSNLWHKLLTSLQGKKKTKKSFNDITHHPYVLWIGNV